jgi:hypothetical protein
MCVLTKTSATCGTGFCYIDDSFYFFPSKARVILSSDPSKSVIANL